MRQAVRAAKWFRASDFELRSDFDIRHSSFVVVVTCALLLGLAASATAQPDLRSLAQEHWFEARTPHFIAYSCGATQAVARVAGRLEQFREAYAVLAGAQAVASPPIVVMAFADHAAMEPFLALYQGKPANVSAFFIRGTDENLIVLPLAGSGSLESIFHEYTHLLLRHNDRIWPIWLEEGMAEIYSTFEVSGGHSVRIGGPIERHLRLLEQTPLLPLASLFAVTQDSADYNERERQGIFYAQSWLLTHYLMLGDSPARRARFGQLTALLRQGQGLEQAFTNAFASSLPAMQTQLQAYLERGNFNPLVLNVAADLSAPRALATRGLSTPEVCFRLGDELFRVDRVESAQAYFEAAQRLAPKSPLAFEGLGLLAVERHQPEEALRLLQEAFQRHSTSFLAHYFYAREKYQLTADPPGRHSRIETEVATEVRTHLEQSLALMPDFGPAQELLGFFEMVQGENLAGAEQHLQRAIQLEPENHSYLFSLAQVELQKGEADTARRTLESLRLPYVEAPLRAEAEELLREMGGRRSRKSE